MNDGASDGIYLTKNYYKEFLPTDLQWDVSKVDEDFTLYDLFVLVKHIDLVMGGNNIPAMFGVSQFDLFWNQIQLDRDPDDVDDVTYLELYWHLGYDIRKTKQTGKSTDQPKGNCAILKDDYNYWDDPKIAELPNLMSFHGVGPGCPSKNLDFHECGDDCPKDTGYGIEFTSVNNLAHLPIRISPKIEFFPPYVESDREFHRTGFQLTIEPTLWCFITSIFWELTFVGSTPNEILNSSNDLTNRIDEVKKHLKEQEDEKGDGNTFVS